MMSIRIEAGPFPEGPDITIDINRGADLGPALEALKEWLEADAGELGGVRIIDPDTGAVLVDDVAVSVAGGSYDLAWEQLRDLVREEVTVYYGFAERKGGVKRTP